MRLLLATACPCKRLGGVVLCGLLLGLTSQTAAVAQSNTLPVITKQPVGGVAGIGENFRFTVEAGVTGPFAYQWTFNGGNLKIETNSSLLLTNLTTKQSGTYGVVVANTAGSIASSNVNLTVQTNAPRRLGIARIVAVTSAVAVPFVLRANGQEHAVSFSLNFDTNAYSNPAFDTGYSNATVALNVTQPGTVGLTLTLPADEMFGAGYRLLGVLRFDLAPGVRAVDGRLAFTTNPVPIQATTTDGFVLALPASVQPQHTVSNTVPQLKRQSGLFEQQIVVSNPGATVMTNVNLAVLSLGFDSLTNDIRLQNAQSFLVNCPLNDCSVDVECECDCEYWDFYYGYCYDYWYCYDVDCTVDISGTYVTTPFVQINDLMPGESRTLTTEFYVTDHTTVPSPRYLSYLDDQALVRAPLTNTTAVPLIEARYLDGVVAVYFPTVATNIYYVQYSDTLDGLATNALTASPPIIGTGNTVQWIDNGPPKTDTPPASGTRFYRILKLQ